MRAQPAWKIVEPRLRRICSGLAVGLLLCSGSIVRAEDTDPLLKHLTQTRQQTFQGVFIYERSGSFNTHQIWQGMVGNQTVRRVLQMDGEPLEYLSKDGRLECASTVFEPGTTTPDAVLDVAHLKALYDVRPLGASRTAGRAAHMFALVPRDPYRYALEWHIDDASGILLKSVLVGEMGQLLERMQYTQFDLKAPEPNALQPTSDCQPPHMYPTQALALEWHWGAAWLPPGFHETSAFSAPSSIDGAPVVTQAYSDGLNHFSIFIEPVHETDVQPVNGQLGPTALLSHRMATSQGDVMITVLGEVPMTTLLRVAAGLTPPKEPINNHSTN